MFRCADDSCKREIKSDRWSKTKSDEWFHQRDGTAYCPDHIPDWVYEWRARRNGTTTQQERDKQMAKKASNAPKVHLRRPTNEQKQMCGKTKGLDTDTPAKVTCLSCTSLYKKNKAWYSKTKRALTVAKKKVAAAGA